MIKLNGKYRKLEFGKTPLVFFLNIFLLIFICNTSSLYGRSFLDTTISEEDSKVTMQRDTEECLFPNHVYIDTQVEQLMIPSTYQGSENVFHLISHGRSGQLLIDGNWLNPSQIAEWLQIRSISKNYTHLNIYGCQFAQGEKGQTAVKYIENILNLSIAASNDITGIDGDWDLEVGSGKEVIQLPEYAHNLQTCSCEEYVYINDPGTNGPVHKFRVEADSTFTEIFSVDATMTPFIAGGSVLLPHGLDADGFGNLYVGNIDRGASATRGIDKFDCAGTLEQANAIPNDEDPANTNGPGGTSLPNGPVGSQTNFFIIEDKMYVNSWVIDDIDGPRVTVYDICSGEVLGFYESCDPVTGTPIVTGDHWGLYVEEETNTAFYNTSQGIVVYDLTQPYGCQDSIIVKQGSNSSNSRGITRLPDGSFVTRNGNELFRYATDGSLLAGPVNMAAIVADEGLGEGGANSYGLVSTEDGRIYVASPGRECASLYDQDLNYLKAAFVVPGGSSGSAKAVAIVKECCPTITPITIDTSLCSATEALFLTDLISCGGSMCITGDPTPGANTNLSFDPCIGRIEVIDPTQYACGSFTLTNDGNGDANQCNAFTITLNVEVGINPEAKVFAIQSSCSDNNPNNDGYLQISEMINGSRFNWSTGSTYMGDPDFANATDTTGLGFPIRFATGRLNPSGSQDYTVRIFSNPASCGGDCYTDYTVTMNEQDCTVGCSCEDYIYLNDAFTNEVHKFQLDSNTGLASEIGSPWTSGINSPHGLAVDNNGDVYINQGADNGVLQKFNCNGDLLDNNFATIAHQVFNIGSKDGVIYIHNNNGNYIEAFSTCDGTSLGQMWVDMGNNTFAWGFYIDDTNWYLPDRISGNIYSGSLDLSFYTTIPTNSGSLLFNIGVSSPDQDYTSRSAVGMTRDENGNFYLVINGIGNNTVSLATTEILKFSPTGTLLGTATDNTGSPNATDGQAGFSAGRGIVYSEITGLLYLGNYENCLTAFDTTLVEQSSLNIGNPSNGLPKGIGINKECCPTSNNINIDTILCEAMLNDTIFLQDLVNCDGSICEGLWMEDMSNTGLIYNSCNNSVTVDALSACGTFTLESDGTANNAQCGAFKITVNIEVENISNNTISSDQIVCAGNTATPLTTTATSSGGTLNYQWQQSTIDCNSGFTNIPTATSDTYAPGAVSQTTYYRLISSINGTCSSGACIDTSNCVTVTFSVNPTATATITPSNCTPAVGDNGTITLADFNLGERFALEANSSYTGSATYASGSTAIPADGIIVNNLPNPSGTQDYTVRIFNSFDCFIDLRLSLTETTCIDYPDYVRIGNPCTDPACHNISNDIYLGSGITPDTSDPSNPNANTDSDNGISLLSNMQFVSGNTVNIPVGIYNNTGTDAYLRMWIDWNGDGDFEDSGEQIENSAYPATGGLNTVFIAVTVPTSALQIESIALRARLSTDDTNSASPCGNGSCAADGEIEDYLINIDCPAPICQPVQLNVRN